MRPNLYLYRVPAVCSGGRGSTSAPPFPILKIMGIMTPKSLTMTTVISIWNLVARCEVANALSHLGQSSLLPNNYFKKVATPVQGSGGLGPRAQLERRMGTLPQDAGDHQRM